MPKYNVVLYDKNDNVLDNRNVSAGNAAGALDLSHRLDAHKIVIERIRENVLLLPKERDAVAELLRQYREGIPLDSQVRPASKREALDHWIKRLEDE